MTTSVFDSNYSEQYDLLYSEKDYESECDMLEEVFRRNLDGNPAAILDLGCGTGNHVIPLAKRGYQVTGVDISGDMLAQAEAKVKKMKFDGRMTPPLFLQSDLRSFNEDKKYDVVLMMFAVLGYQTANEHVMDAMHTVARHLRPGGLFVFDVWYGPAVLKIKPSDRVKVIELADGELIRSASCSLDIFQQLAEVNYRLWRIRDHAVISETKESHLMRYFFPQELAFFLLQSGLSLQSLTAFPDLTQPATEESWNALAVARN
jgi:SAM-dependent methyltransferase